MWATIVFGLDCAAEVRKRSNATWLKIDYGQLHIRIRSMWLRRVYFVPLKILRAKLLATKRQTVSLKDTTASSRSHAAIVSQRALDSKPIIFDGDVK